MSYRLWTYPESGSLVWPLWLVDFVSSSWPFLIALFSMFVQTAMVVDAS